MKRLLLLLSVPLIIQGNLYAQKASVDELLWYEDTLSVLGEQLVKAKEEAQRIAANDQFHELLYQALTFENSFDYPFIKLVSIAQLGDKEGLFRIFNWSLRFDDGRFKYFAFVLIKQKDAYKLIELKDGSTETRKFPDQEVFETENWYGAYYYQLVEVEKRKKRQYLLLGWDGYEIDANQKIIEVLNISENGEISFGAPIFNVGESIKYRHFIRFKEDASVSMRYYEELQQIIFDHLVPLQPIMEGMYQFYVSDFTYDGFSHNNFKWKFQSGIDARNQENKVKREKKINNNLFQD